MLEILDAGLAPHLVPYRDGWDLQRRIHAEVAGGERGDTLILLEHEAVFTAGSRTLPHERPTSGSAPVVDVDRGGKITWHGPGQLVGYPIVQVGERGGLDFVRRLEGALISVAAAFGVAGRRVEGRSGVWTADGSAKIAAIGMRVAQGVTMHGFALNCSCATDPFAEIIACGIADVGTTTLARESGRTIAPSDARDAVAAALTEIVEGVPA
nr:lipoyl(octanoyl) transferase LipB [Microbacterium indicum]